MSLKPSENIRAVALVGHGSVGKTTLVESLLAKDITLETRIITTADIFDAITAERPYRGAVPVDQTLAIMQDSVGTAIDATCLAHLQRVIAQNPELFPG